MDALVGLIAFAILMLLGLLAGGAIERKHYDNIRQRERQTRHIPMVTFGAKQALSANTEGKLFVGSVVISADYFKIVVAGLRNLVGGRVMVYETVLDRARREAILRLKEQAVDWGASQIANVRLETANVGSSNNQGIVAIEVAAYGTGIRQEPASLPR
ncbi:YbjQ family protein [Synechococcus sp. PCC 7336]|uniref:YbjQ family protein n=1 Tax=Synechococcus sp. PCC 7336 TaxID=195250 RepID=UPI0003490D72|nr:heavy metal-binding domain-containing protein [Synechococcus sp. PCC 7336]